MDIFIFVNHRIHSACLNIITAIDYLLVAKAFLLKAMADCSSHKRKYVIGLSLV